jgi:hypothetical protein
MTTMKIEVQDAREAEQLKAGLESPEVRAFVRLVGILAPLSDRARRRVLAFTQDRIAEEAAMPKEAHP